MQVNLTLESFSTKNGWKIINRLSIWQGGQYPQTILLFLPIKPKITTANPPGHQSPCPGAGDGCHRSG